jgi:hypothetical protein
MSGPMKSLPERLRTAESTDFERRLLEAASRERPSRELCERMAQAIGVSPPPIAPPDSMAPGASVATPGAALGIRALLPWVSGTVVLAIAAGAIVAARTSTSTSSAPQAGSASAPLRAPVPVPVPSPPPAPIAVPPEASGESSSSTTAAAPAHPGRRASATAADLRDQIALIDAARAAVSAGAGDRALEILRKYQGKYAAGSFRPEATALKIEALVKLERTAEARALAERFVVEHDGSPLAERVARVAGLDRQE